MKEWSQYGAGKYWNNCGQRGSGNDESDRRPAVDVRVLITGSTRFPFKFDISIVRYYPIFSCFITGRSRNEMETYYHSGPFRSDGS